MRPDRHEGEAESPSLRRVMITSPALAWFLSASPDHRIRDGPVEAEVSGAQVRLGHQIAGRGEHDRVWPGRPVRGPRGKGILGGGGRVADVDAPPHSGRTRRLAEGAAMIRALHDSVGGCAISGSGEVAWSCDRI